MLNFGRVVSERLEKPQIFFFALLVFLLWAPLPLGSNRPWSASLLVLLSSTLLLVYVCTRQPKHKLDAPTPILWAVGLYVAAILWAIIQWSPWTPSIWHHPIWAIGAESLDKSLDGRITVNPSATLASALNLVGYLCTFFLAYEVGRSTRFAHQFLYGLTAIVSIYSLYGLIVFSLGNESLLHYEKWVYHDALTSTFVNRNSFATYVGLGFLCSIAVLLHLVVPILKSDIRPRVKARIILEYLGGQGRYALSAMLVNGSALMLTSSRAGIACTFVGTLMLTFLMTSSRRTSLAKRGIGISIFALFLIGIMSLASGPLLSRIDNIGVSYTQNERSKIHALVTSAILDAPVLGTGLGTFPDIFPGYRDTNSFTSKAWVKAHSTYLENALELGLPAALALNLAIALAGLVCLRRSLKRKRNQTATAVAIAATVLVGLHATVDFSLQIPAVAVTFSALLGIGVGAANTPNGKRVRRIR